MNVTKGHPYAGVTEEAGDHRDRNSLHDRVTGEIMAQVMKANVLDASLPADPGSDAKFTATVTIRAERGRKDPWASSARLPVENRPCLQIEVHLSRAGLAVTKEQRALAKVRPAQGEDFRLPGATASGSSPSWALRQTARDRISASLRKRSLPCLR